MTTLLTRLGLAAALALATTATIAAPCAVGTTASTKDASSKDTSSNTDHNAAPRTTPGAKGESAGTVGAMNNTGASSTPGKGEKPAPEGQVVKPGDDNC